MNNYESKQQAKKERFEELAEKNSKKSDKLWKSGSDALKMIPFGQPILVGHHSEKSHRGFLAKNRSKLDKSLEVSKKADYYANKAENIGTGGISSDDPAAVVKLKEKMENLEKSVKFAKEYNAKIRKFKTKANALIEVEKLPEDNKDKKVFQKMLKSCDYYAFPPDRIRAYYFNTTSNNAEIRRIKQRIEILIKTATMVEKEDVIGDGYVIKEDKEDNRIKFIFDGKPEAEIRTTLKSNGFRWSPYNKAWQRMLNGNGRYATKRVVQELSSLK